MPIGGLLGNDTGWWLNPANQMDGVNPDLFADPTGMRYMLNQREVTAADIFALSSAAGKTYVDASGVLRTAGVNEVRVDYSSGVGEILFEGAATNKMTIFNASPTSTAGLIREGDAAATITLVNDTAALTAAGINIGNGNVYLLDNTAGVGVAAATVNVECGNTNQHAMSAYARCEGQGSIRRNAIGATIQLINNQSTYIRIGGVVTPAAATNRLSMNVTAGGRLWFILPNLVEATSVTSTIITAGSATTRTADIVPLTAAARAVLAGGAGGAVAARGVYPVLPISGSRIVGFSTLDFLLAGPNASNTQAQAFANAIGLNAPAGSGLLSTGFGMVNSYGSSGRRLCLNGGTVVGDANIIDGTDLASVFIGPSTGMQAGQVIRLRQLVGWTLADRASAAAVQAQARAA